MVAGTRKQIFCFVLKVYSQGRIILSKVSLLPMVYVVKFSVSKIFNFLFYNPPPTVINFSICDTWPYSLWLPIKVQPFLTQKLKLAAQGCRIQQRCWFIEKVLTDVKQAIIWPPDSNPILDDPDHFSQPLDAYDVQCHRSSIFLGWNNFQPHFLISSNWPSSR